MATASQDIYNLPVYVINLDRRPDRWRQFQDLSGIHAFKQIKRWSATDGKTLDLSGDTRISLHTRYNISRNFRRAHHEINTAGAIGASFSHYRVWRDLLDGSAPGCIVFEDDVYLDPEILARMRSAFSHAPACDMFLFGNHVWNYKDTNLDKGLSQDPYRKVLEFNGAHAYYVSRSFAEVLCANFFPIEQHVEFYMYLTARAYNRLIVRHKGLRVSYVSEVAGDLDSDTFVSINTCPLCLIPDDMGDGVYMTSQKIREVAVGVAVISACTIGYILGRKA